MDTFILFWRRIIPISSCLHEQILYTARSRFITLNTQTTILCSWSCGQTFVHAPLNPPPKSVVRAAENSAQQQRTKVNRQSEAVLAPAFGVAALRRHPGVRESPELEPAIGFAALKPPCLHSNVLQFWAFSIGIQFFPNNAEQSQPQLSAWNWQQQ